VIGIGIVGAMDYGWCSLYNFDIQTRLESIEAVNNILDEANKSIQPTGAGIAIVLSNFGLQIILLGIWEIVM